MVRTGLELLAQVSPTPWCIRDEDLGVPGPDLGVGVERQCDRECVGLTPRPARPAGAVDGLSKREIMRCLKRYVARERYPLIHGVTAAQHTNHELESAA